MTPADFAALDITNDSILAVYVWGFGSVLAMWAIGYAVGCVVELIRKL